MLTDELLSLITAAVDGELTPSEARRFARLLESSPEARTLYAQLQADSERVRTQSPVLAPVGLFQRIMAKVAAVRPPTIAEPARPLGRPKPKSWTPVAVAASVLLAVGLGSFLFFSRDSEQTQAVAHNGSPPPANRKGSKDSDWAKWLPAESGPRPSVPVPAERDRPGRVVVDGNTAPVVPQPQPIEGIAIAPEPRPARGDAFGSPLRPEIQLNFADVRIPFLKALADFEGEDPRTLLADELAHDPAFRIDLFTRDPNRAVQAFQAAAKASGLNLTVDATTLDRLKRQQVSSAVVFTESLTPAELADLFGKLAAEDAKISPRVFEMLHATAALKADQDGLKEVLGIDPGLFKRPAPEKGSKSEKLPDPTKPLSAGTADQIVKSLTGAGQGKPGEKSAVLLAWSPALARTQPATSAELKQFLMKRGERKPNAVPVLIVIR